MELSEAITDIESRYLRTCNDTGANSNALFIHNAYRLRAGLKPVMLSDLYVKERNEYLMKMGEAYLVEDMEKAERYKRYIDSLDESWERKLK